MSILVSIIVFVIGASLGSFINVVVYRLPAGLSVLWPPSRCPQCLNRLKAYDNVPVLGWFWLKGRCRYCQTKISFRYPLVEALTGIIFLIVFWVFQFSIFSLTPTAAPENKSYLRWWWVSRLGGLHSTEVAYLLLTQQPRV